MPQGHSAAQLQQSEEEPLQLLPAPLSPQTKPNQTNECESFPWQEPYLAHILTAWMMS